jgi:succinoglycan biosynthesis protein ExoV
LLIGIGSVLDANFNSDFFDHYKKKIVLGAGARGCNRLFDIERKDWDVRFVRGKNTTTVFGLAEEKAISDPAILITRFLPPESPLLRKKQTRPQKPVLGLVPYWATSLAFSEAIATINNMTLIPVYLTPERFFTLIASCDVVIVEAMHGAIIADSLGVPWIPCRMTNMKCEGDTHGFKWSDWLDTLDLHPKFITVPVTARMPGESFRNDITFAAKVRKSASIIRRAIQNVSWNLSDRDLLAYRQDQMLKVIDEMKFEIMN